ncbi:HAD family hydrolase [Streptomyces sp. NPDC054933]
MRLVLWDIDHTLIDTRGVGRELSAEAFEEATGQPMERQAKIDGITEPVIFRETAKLHGIDTGRADFERFADALHAGHLRRAADLRERGHALPGAVAALDALAALPGVVQTVVSGNVRSVAEVKLQVFGLDRHIVWEIGAFGEDNDDRAALVRTALQRASKHLGVPVEASDAALVGDTPADVQAAQENRVFVIAVASGRSSMEELGDAGAQVVLPDLTDTDALVELVQGLGERLCS